MYGIHSSYYGSAGEGALIISYFLHLRLRSSKVKAEQSDNDAIVDDVAGKAYVEQFGLETLERAENTMKQSRVSR